MIALNLLIWLVLLAAALFFGWLVVRSWKAKRWYVKAAGLLFGSLLLLATSAVVVITGIGMLKLYQPAGSPPEQLSVAGTPEQIAQGKYLANAFCVSCHSTNGELPMMGGVDMSRDIPLPIGKLISANLTPAGPLKDYTDGEIMRVLREGVDKNRRKLVVMSGIFVRNMSDEDINALIAYLRSEAPVENPLPRQLDQVNLLGAAMAGMGLIPSQPAVSGPIVAPHKAATVEYGKYVISYQDCRVCHGLDLAGGKNQLTPNGPTLRQVKGWSQEQFIQTLRTGITPGGQSLGNIMPWKTAGRMDDTDLAALYLYITSLQ